MIPKAFLGAFKAGHVPACRPFIDEELSWKLLDQVLDHGCEESRKVLEFITKFNNEYYKAVVKIGDETAFHADNEVRKELGRIKYSRRMDAMSRFDLIYYNPRKEKIRKF